MVSPSLYNEISCAQNLIANYPPAQGLQPRFNHRFENLIQIIVITVYPSFMQMEIWQEFPGTEVPANSRE